MQRVVVDQQYLQVRAGGRAGRLLRAVGFLPAAAAYRYRDDELTALAQAAFERDAAAEQFYQTVDDRKPQTEPVDALRRTQAYELLENAFFLLAADAPPGVAHGEYQPSFHDVGPDRHTALVRKFQRIGYQVIGNLADPERIAHHLVPGPRPGFEHQGDALCLGHGRKPLADRLEQLCRAERHVVDVDLVDIEPVEVQQAVDQRQQVFRRFLHIVQVKPFAFARSEARKQVDIPHHRPQRRLDVVRDGQHQFLTRRQQRLVVAVGPFERPPVAGAAVDITQQDTHEQQHQHDGDGGDTAQHVRRPATDSLRLVDLAQQERRILGFEIHDEAVNLRIHQFVAVAEAHPFVPRPVVNADAVAGHPILQRPEDDGDRILHGRRGERIDDPLTVGDHDARILFGRTEQVGETAEEIALAPRHRHGQRILHHRTHRHAVAQNPHAVHTVRRADQLADILVQQAGRSRRTDRPPQVHRPPLLVAQQPHNAVQAHRLERILLPGQVAQRVDIAAHGAQFTFVPRLVRLVSGDHQLAVTLGLVEVVEGLSHDIALGVQQRITAVGGRKTHHRTVNIPD